MSNSHINKLKSGVMRGRVENNITFHPHFFSTTTCRHVWIFERLPSSTNYSCRSFPFRHNGGFTDTQTVYYCIYKPVGTIQL